MMRTKWEILLDKRNIEMPYFASRNQTAFVAFVATLDRKLTCPHLSRAVEGRGELGLPPLSIGAFSVLL